MATPELESLQQLVARSEARFDAHSDKIHRETDRAFLFVLLGQWAFAVVLALAVSPYSWSGKTATVHLHVYAALLGGALLNSLPIALILKRPGSALTRHSIAVAQMLWSVLLIHLTAGRIETHFHVFGSLGFLAYYRDWRVLLTATVVTVADHFAIGLLDPLSLYGISNPEWWRLLEHSFWVLFCDAFLVLAALRSVREMREIAERESLAESQWFKAALPKEPA